MRAAVRPTFAAGRVRRRPMRSINVSPPAAAPAARCMGDNIFGLPHAAAPVHDAMRHSRTITLAEHDLPALPGARVRRRDRARTDPLPVEVSATVTTVTTVTPLKAAKWVGGYPLEAGVDPEKQVGGYPLQPAR